MDRTWKIIRIDEPDYGCEGVPDEVAEGKILRRQDMDKIVVQAENGEEKICFAPDRFLVEKGLDEGSEVDPEIFQPFDQQDAIQRIL